MRSSEQRLRLMMESLPAGVAYVDGSRITVNKGLKRITTFDRTELTSVNAWFRLLCREEAEEARRHYEHDRTDGLPQRRQMSISRKSGEVRIIEIAGYRYEKGEVWLVRDVTLVKKSEGELQKFQRLDLVGILAGGIAHDFNNLLIAIMGNITPARKDLEADGPGAAALTKAEAASAHARRLIWQL